MIDDPWATNDSTIDNTKETVTVTTNDDPFCITLKQQGKDAPWIVIRSGTAEEAKSRLQEAMNSGLFDSVNQAQSSFAGAPPAPAQSFQRASQAPAQQAAPQGEPAWADGRTCAHGRMNAKEGTNVKGNPYKAYFCPERDRSQQCKAVWL